MRGRAATYTLRPGVVVRGVITDMPFFALVVSIALVCTLVIVGELGQNDRIETLAVRSISQSAPMTIATTEPPPITTRA